MSDIGISLYNPHKNRVSLSKMPKFEIKYIRS